MSNKWPFLVQDSDGNLVTGAAGSFVVTAYGAFNGAPRPAPVIAEVGGGYELQPTDAEEAYGTAVLVDVGAGREPRYHAFALHKSDNSNFFFAFVATTPEGEPFDAGVGAPGAVVDWTGPTTPPVVQLEPALFVVRPTAGDMAADASGRVDMAAGALPAHYTLGVEPYVTEVLPVPPSDVSPVVQAGDFGAWPDGDLLVKLGTIEISPGVRVVSFEQGFDFELAANDLRTDAGLQNAVALSLFCDARASADEEAEAPQRRGWWGERLLPGDDAPWGSKAWLLDRSTVTAEARERRRRYDLDALQWLLADGIAATIEVTVEAQGRGGFLETISIYRPGVNDPSRFRFASVWEAQQRRT